jgi:hypothetical protein
MRRVVKQKKIRSPIRKISMSCQGKSLLLSARSKSERQTGFFTILSCAVYDFPAQNCPHLRTTNPIESTFATVRLRTHRTKGCGSRIATLTMVFKLGLEAQKHWRRLQGFELIPKVVTGVRFVDAKNNPNRPLNQSFQQGCTRPQ